MDNLSKLIILLPDEIKTAFTSLTKQQFEDISEVRIRKNKPLIVYIKKDPYFICTNNKIINHKSDSCVSVSDQQFEYILNNVCNNSFHSHIHTLKEGFVTTHNGLRVGIAASAVFKNGELHSVKDISSLCIRLPHNFPDCSKSLLSDIYSDPFPSLIIASPPSGGKTTLIRDLAQKLSDGYRGQYKKIAVIDERNEISNGFDLGTNCDIIRKFDKKSAIEIATRTLAPDIIICDEIGSTDEVNSIGYGFCTGVSFIVTAHAYSLSDLMNRSVIKKLVNSKEFKYIILLEDYSYKYKIYEISEEGIENNRKYIDNIVFSLNGI